VEKFVVVVVLKVTDKIAGTGAGSVSQRYGSADPDPDSYQKVMDPQDNEIVSVGNEPPFTFHLSFTKICCLVLRVRR
jgi:hypothetical protein